MQGARAPPPMLAAAPTLAQVRVGFPILPTTRGNHTRRGGISARIRAYLDAISARISRASPVQLWRRFAELVQTIEFFCAPLQSYLRTAHDLSALHTSAAEILPRCRELWRGRNTGAPAVANEVRARAESTVGALPLE